MKHCFTGRGKQTKQQLERAMLYAMQCSQRLLLPFTVEKENVHCIFGAVGAVRRSTTVAAVGEKRIAQ